MAPDPVSKIVELATFQHLLLSTIAKMSSVTSVLILNSYISEPGQFLKYYI